MVNMGNLIQDQRRVGYLLYCSRFDDIIKCRSSSLLLNYLGLVFIGLLNALVLLRFLLFFRFID